MSNQPKAENGWVTMGGEYSRIVRYNGLKAREAHKSTLKDVMPDTEWTSACKMVDYYMTILLNVERMHLPEAANAIDDR